MQRTLVDNPQAGPRLVGRRERRNGIPRTPFSVTYRVTGDRIEVLRVHDERSDPARME